jgi:hypothetical protein
MSTIDVTDTSLTTLLDDYAMNAMLALMQVYAPEEWPKEHEDADKWCDFISTRSYYMAAAMMDARSSFHNVLLDVAKEEEQDAA